jgi:transaldolase
MQIFLDSADKASIERALKTGLVSGLTTNPTLLSKIANGQNIDNMLKQICALMDPFDVSIEVTEQEPAAVYAQAKKIAQIAPNVVVKIPCAYKYLEVINKLVQEDIPVNITLVFTVMQGLLMAQLGVRYISPFVGRLDDIDSNGLELIEELRTVLDNYGLETQILAASMRHIRHVHQVALLGADIVTMPVELFEHLLDHPLSKLGMEKFESDWKKLGIGQFP